MANYTKTTNFLIKDSYASGNPDKVVKGSEIDAEFVNISTAIASKANTDSPIFTGTPIYSGAPIAAGTNTSQLATTAFVTSVYPSQANSYTGVQTFRNTTFEIVDATDITKKATFTASGITSGTTRAFIFPDKSGTLAVTSDLAGVSPLSTTTNTIVSGSYSVSGSSTITFTATNGFSAGQEVNIDFTRVTDATLVDGKYTIVSANGSSFTINYGSTVTSSGDFSAERYGIIAVANAAEAIDRTKTTKAITPATLRDAINAQNAPPIYACRAWVTFDATRNAAGTSTSSNTTRFIYASGNVTSVLKTDDGKFTITLTTAMPNTNYAVTGQAKGGTANNATMVNETGTRTTSTIEIGVSRRDGGEDGATDNSDFVSIAIFG